MNKKGFIFTFISVVLISVIVLAFLIQYTSRTRVNIESVNTEVETMNSFVKALNNDYFSRALEISTNQAILALLDCMDPLKECDEGIEDDLRNGGYLGENENQLKAYIKNAILYRKFSLDQGIPDNDPLLELMSINGVEYNLSSALSEVVALANNTGIILEHSVVNKGSLDIFQDGPWDINVTMIISYTARNNDGDISWNYGNIEIKTSVPIYNFRDPFYMVEAEVNVGINKSIYNLPDEIEYHVLNVNFIKCDESPDFLTRMMGGTDAKEGSGIESLVDLKSSAYSVVDFQYFNEINPTKISIGDSGYYIDQTHGHCYNLD